MIILQLKLLNKYSHRDVEKAETDSFEVILNFKGVFQQMPLLFTVLPAIPRFEGRPLYKVSKVVSLTMRERERKSEESGARARGNLAKTAMIVGANLHASDVIIQTRLGRDEWILAADQKIPKIGHLMTAEN